MRVLRTVTPQPEMWDVRDIMTYLSCDETKAKEIMKECKNQHGISGYGAIEKHLILDFINAKQREERDREARYQSDLANTEISTSLKEQVKALREHVKIHKEQLGLLGEQVRALELNNARMNEVSRAASENARATRMQARVANIISGVSIVIAILALVLN